MEITLHYYPSNASVTPHILLHELGVPFQLQLVDRRVQAHKAAEYLRLNPNGLIPTLVLRDAYGPGSGEQVLYETAAIVLQLVDLHPQAGLAPLPGTRERGEFYKWLEWLACSVQPWMTHYFYSDRMAAPGNAEGAAQVKAAAEAMIASRVDQIEARLAQQGPWMMGERFSALDPYAFMLCRWTRGMTRPARTLPHVGAFLQRMLARPSLQKVIATEQWAEPLV